MGQIGVHLHAARAAGGAAGRGVPRVVMADEDRLKALLLLLHLRYPRRHGGDGPAEARRLRCGLE